MTPLGGRDTPTDAVDAEAWIRGDIPVLGAVVDGLGPEVWRLARRGFVCADETKVTVGGIEDADDIIEDRIAV